MRCGDAMWRCDVEARCDVAMRCEGAMWRCDVETQCDVAMRCGDAMWRRDVETRCDVAVVHSDTLSLANNTPYVHISLHFEHAHNVEFHAGFEIQHDF